jgi:hypothetical protein
VLGTAVVVEGTGFKAAAVRAVVAGLRLVTRTSFPRRAFDTVGPASQWIYGDLLQSATAPRDVVEMEAFVAKLRGAIPGRAASG